MYNLIVVWLADGVRETYAYATMEAAEAAAAGYRVAFGSQVCVYIMR